MNVITVSGIVTKDPIVSQTRTGSKVVNFSVAVRDDRRNVIGQYETYFFRVSCWGYVAEFAQKYIQKGNFVVVEGKAVVTKWKDNFTGKTLYGWEIHADHVENGLHSYGRKPTKDGQGRNNLTDYLQATEDGENATDSMYT